MEETEAPAKCAFIGVRPCDLHAVAIHDKVFLSGKYTDSSYAVRREKIFVVAVNCAKPGNTCFCVSMNTGPKATTGFDLALTEVVEGERHYFVVEVGSEAGATVLREVPHREAGADEKAVMERVVTEATKKMGKTLEAAGVRELLSENLEHPFWEEVAERCLVCGNCTMVCPTCFCTTVEDVTDLSGETAERLRRWDSCFTEDFSYIHGGSVRASAWARYRQWLTHKLATWLDQFGTLGCVGCGRCITWCPAGIDITETVSTLQAKERPRGPAGALEEHSSR